MTTMIALVGEQPLPNFLAVRQLLAAQPSTRMHVLLVYTEKTEKHFIYLRDKLALEVTVHELKTDPYDIHTIVDDLQTILNKLEKIVPMPFIFNLTGGTKTMSLAAYQVAAMRHASVLYLQSEDDEDGQSVIDYYNWHDHQFIHQTREPVTEYITLRDMLELHLGPESEKNWSVKGTTIQTDTHSHLFEEAIAQVLSEHGYETLCGVKGKKDQLDIDVMIGYQNQIGIIEAKTSEKDELTKLEAIKQLSWATRYIKGTYIKQFVVTNSVAAPNLKAMGDALEIPIISLRHYKRGPDATFLSYEDEATLLDQIDKKMKPQG